MVAYRSDSRRSYTIRRPPRRPARPLNAEVDKGWRGRYFAYQSVGDRPIGSERTSVGAAAASAAEQHGETAA